MKSARLPATALAKTRSPSVVSVTPAPKKSDARPIATRTRPASDGSQQLLGHGRAGSTLDGRGRERCVLGHRLAGGRAVGVDVLQAHEQRAVAFGCAEHSALQRREELRATPCTGRSGIGR